MSPKQKKIDLEKISTDLICAEEVRVILKSHLGLKFDEKNRQMYVVNREKADLFYEGNVELWGKVKSWNPTKDPSIRFIGFPIMFKNHNYDCNISQSEIHNCEILDGKKHEVIVYTY